MNLTNISFIISRYVILSNKSYYFIYDGKYTSFYSKKAIREEERGNNTFKKYKLIIFIDYYLNYYFL